MNKEIAIYASIYTNSLDLIQSSLQQILNSAPITLIEQNTVLIYEDSVIELSIEPHNTSYYLSGRIKEGLKIGEALIIKITDKFKENGMIYSLDYQEENDNGAPTSPEYNISNKIDNRGNIFDVLR